MLPIRDISSKSLFKFDNTNTINTSVKYVYVDVSDMHTSCVHAEILEPHTCRRALTTRVDVSVSVFDVSYLALSAQIIHRAVSPSASSAIVVSNDV